MGMQERVRDRERIDKDITIQSQAREIDGLAKMVVKLNGSLMPIALDTTNGHDESVISKFNEVAKKYENYTLLHHILHYWADDDDLLDITRTLEDNL